MNILIIQGAKLGDMVCTTPMFRAVKHKYPDAHLVVMGDALNKEVLAGNPYIDEYIVLPQTRQELQRVVKSKKFDYACITSPNPSALLALLLARVPRIVVPQIRGGFSPYATKTYRLLSLFATRVPHTMGTYAPREYLRLLEPLGIVTDDTRKDIVVAEAAKARVEKILQEADALSGAMLVGIAPGAGNKVKVWGGQKFAKVVEALQQRHTTKVVIIGGMRDTEEVQSMLQALSNKTDVVDLSGKLSIEELKALIAKLALFVSVDTGPIYIAEALGVPTVDIVGPMDQREQPPQGERHKVVVAPGRKAPAMHIMNASMLDMAEVRRQTEAVTTESVVAAASALLKRA